MTTQEVKAPLTTEEAARAEALRTSLYSAGVGQTYDRYRIDALIAQGGEGRVFLVTDTELHRRVAMKVLNPVMADDPAHIQRFLAEARRTSSLQHVGIPAVHEVGCTQAGDIFFTMRLIQGETFGDVLRGLADGDRRMQEDWPMLRRVQALQSVANTVHYAHSRGLVHRDLKPDNIVVGEFGEVLVIDWGLAKRIADDPEMPPLVPDEQLHATIVGHLKGTPLYMAPEQARGDVDSTDSRTDVFGLGALLYQALTLSPPYEGARLGAVLTEARAGTIRCPTERLPDQDFPRVLVDIAMRGLSRDPDARQRTAGEFAGELQSYIDGTRERELRGEECAALLDDAREFVRETRRISQQALGLDAEAERLEYEIPPWSSPEEKAPLWAIESRKGELRVRAAEAHANAAELVSRCLVHAPNDLAARELMGELYSMLLRKAEKMGDAVEVAWLRRKVDAYNDGALDSALRNSGTIELGVQPLDSVLTVARWAEDKRRLRLTEAQVIDGGEGLLDLPNGSYQLTISYPGRVTANVPIHVTRGGKFRLDVNLLHKERVPDGFVWVPRGPFLRGRRPDLAEVWVTDFVIQRRPVLLREYATWLDEVFAADPREARRRVPGTAYQGAMLVVKDGRHLMGSSDGRSGRRLDDLPDFPVVAISHCHAVEYAEWLGKRLGTQLRLPTEVEWEKAARGTDGRLYPWGDRFDATFCSMASSSPSEPRLRPVEWREADVSPYGVRDMAGGVHEWCLRSQATSRRTAPSRGGAWYSQEEECTVLSRWLVEPTSRSMGIGFRLAAELR